jgi:hypothetical protein
MNELSPVTYCDLGQEMIDVLHGGGGAQVDSLLARGDPGTDHNSFRVTFDCSECPFIVKLYESGRGRWCNANTCSLAAAAVALMIAEAQTE